MTLVVDRYTGLNEASSARWAGDVLTLDAWDVCSTLAVAQGRRTGLSALAGSGLVVPVHSSVDTSLSGFYTVESCSTTSEPGTWDARFAYRYSLNLRRVPDWQATIQSLRSNGRERSGAPGGPSEDYWVGVPTSVYGFDLSGDNAVYYTRTGPGGSVRMYVDASLSNNVATYTIAPADHYDMAPRVLVDGVEVTGRQVLALGNATDWQMDNGFLRVRNAASASDTFRVAGPDPANTSAWQPDAEHAYQYGLYLASTERVMSPTTIQVRRLTCEVAQIRLRGYVSTSGTADEYAVTLDLSLRRGSSYIECVGSSIASAIHRLDDAGAGALTADTLGAVSGKAAHQTSNDADGNRWWIASTVTMNTGLIASGSVRTNASVTSWPFGLGIELDGTSAVAPNRHLDDQYDHYWADQTIVHEVGG